MKTIKFELQKLNAKKDGLQFVHDYFMSYLVRAGIKKFEKLLKECDVKNEEIMNRIKKEKG